MVEYFVCPNPSTTKKLRPNVSHAFLQYFKKSIAKITKEICIQFFLWLFCVDLAANELDSFFVLQPDFVEITKQTYYSHHFKYEERPRLMTNVC